MPRPVRSFAERLAETEKREVLETITTTERLLVEILLQLMAIQAERGQADIARRLKRAGFSTKQVAALLDTTPASLAVAAHREKVDAE